MKRFFLLQLLLIFSGAIMAKTIVVKNADELKKANATAAPGDTVVLQDGIWKDINISLTCSGTAEQPITFKAQTNGNVIISGHSTLSVGGNYLNIQGLYFTNGYAGDRAIISFRSSKAQVANNCRVTETVIDNFNNPKRLDENYWVEFYGKHNRLDHCSFRNKKNMGVMMAVVLDDKRSEENFHSIDHNYFGFRLPLASNTGETIRVGVSQQAEFNSNTQITDNFFEHCDGETEIISLKSGSNVVRNNLFKECQGAVVLRHGNDNTVENNIFLGNNKPGTGGVRVINRGQWVVNNLFYQCIGTGFRSPLAVMNGVPNSPANRYVAVSDAVIANNSFVECTPVSFAEGSDTERSEAPHNVQVLNNIFYSDKGGPVFYKYDDISRIYFDGNAVSMGYKQDSLFGFSETAFTLKKEEEVMFPVPKVSGESMISDSLKTLALGRLTKPLSTDPGFSGKTVYSSVLKNAYEDCGAPWFAQMKTAKRPEVRTIDCATANEIVTQLKDASEAIITINLTGKKYHFDSPLNIKSNVTFTSAGKNEIDFSTANNLPFLFQLVAGNTLNFTNCQFDLNKIKAASFISTDTSGSSNHSNISIRESSFENFRGMFLNAAKTSVLDSLIVDHCVFEKNTGTLFNFMHEDDKKGYYNVEKLAMTNNKFYKQQGRLLGMLRTGNDESTMGPYLIFENNTVEKSNNKDALIYLYGTQRSVIASNTFLKSNEKTTLIKYEDIVRADHFLKNNQVIKSGSIEKNEFVED